MTPAPRTVPSPPGATGSRDDRRTGSPDDDRLIVSERVSCHYAARGAAGAVLAVTDVDATDTAGKPADAS